MVAHPWGAQNDMTADDWENFILGPGWAPSMMMTNDVAKSGTKAIVDAMKS
jgi:hypothetical protein